MIKAHHFLNQAHCFAFGGFEIQMLSTIESINLVGEFDAIKHNYWDCSKDFEIAHFWGLSLTHYDNIIWAKKNNKKVIVTALLSYYETPMQRIKKLLSNFIYDDIFKNKMISVIDALVVISDEQKEIAIKYYSIDSSKVFVIPNIVSNNFFDLTDINKVEFSNYILTTGNVCRRKNQLQLARAVRYIPEVKLVIIGSLMDGEDSYGKELEDTINESEGQIKWIKGLPYNSKELVSYVKYAKAFALISEFENQPISLLEAAAAQIPLIIANKKFAVQKYYKNARLVDPHSLKSIVSGINDVLINPSHFIPDLQDLKNCSIETVGDQYSQLYKSLIR
jgi:glycosyltransferase involved in cell wall biosynthesis